MNLFILTWKYKGKIKQLLSDLRSINEVEAVLKRDNLDWIVKDIYDNVKYRSASSIDFKKREYDSTSQSEVYRLVWSSDHTYEVLGDISSIRDIVLTHKLTEYCELYDLAGHSINMFSGDEM